MTFNHLVLIGGGHSNVLLIKKWLMCTKLMPEIPVSIISRDSHLVYSAMFPSVLSKSISLEESLIDIKSLAKNASRLDFNISNNSLKQSQETVRQWPWKSSETHQKMIYPPALGIRIRMELAEIYKHDNLNNVISIIHKWEIISILNENIKVDERFLRGLNWIKKLNGNYMLYLLKDSEDLERACQRFLVNNSEIKILEDYSNIKKILKTNQKKFNYFSPSSWTEFIEDRNLNDETVKLLICDGGLYWRNLFKWLFIYKFIKSKKDGETLKKEGWDPGKEMGKEIKRLRYLEIDNLNRN